MSGLSVQAMSAQKVVSWKVSKSRSPVSRFTWLLPDKRAVVTRSSTRQQGSRRRGKRWSQALGSGSGSVELLSAGLAAAAVRSSGAQQVAMMS